MEFCFTCLISAHLIKLNHTSHLHIPESSVIKIRKVMINVSFCCLSILILRFMNSLWNCRLIYVQKFYRLESNTVTECQEGSWQIWSFWRQITEIIHNIYVCMPCLEMDSDTVGGFMSFGFILLRFSGIYF